MEQSNEKSAITQTPITYKHSCTSGDILYWLSGIKRAWELYGKKGIVYQRIDQPGFFYQGAQHPYNGVMMNQYAFDMLKPLILAQPYIEDWREWKGETIMIDMDKVRVMKPLMPYGNIIKWFGYCFGDIMPDVSNEWIYIKRSLKEGTGTSPWFEEDKNPDLFEKILINRTSRYRNQWISYFFLQTYKDKLVFSGLPDEHQAFCKEWELDIPLLEVKDFYELAVAIKSCKFYIGNQSMGFAIAEAMKVPRILEVCPEAPNVDPVGEHAYDFLYQEYFQYYVKHLNEVL